MRRVRAEVSNLKAEDVTCSLVSATELQQYEYLKTQVAASM
jgi:hypothetical protein